MSNGYFNQQLWALISNLGRVSCIGPPHHSFILYDDENIWQKYTTPFVSGILRTLNKTFFKHVDTNMKSSWLKHHVVNHLLMWPYHPMEFKHLYTNVYTFWLKDHLNQEMWSDLDNRVLNSSQSDDECILIIFKIHSSLKLGQ